MTAGHPVDEREWTRTIHALLTILVAKLGPERHVHDVPVAGLDDIEEVEVRMLELDDERRRVGGLRTCDGNPDRAEGRPVLRVCDAIVDGFDGTRVKRGPGMELQPAADLERDRHAVWCHRPAGSALRHVVT